MCWRAMRSVRSWNYETSSNSFLVLSLDFSTIELGTVAEIEKLLSSPHFRNRMNEFLGEVGMQPLV